MANFKSVVLFFKHETSYNEQRYVRKSLLICRAQFTGDMLLKMLKFVKKLL